MLPYVTVEDTQACPDKPSVYQITPMQNFEIMAWHGPSVFDTRDTLMHLNLFCFHVLKPDPKTRYVSAFYLNKQLDL